MQTAIIYTRVSTDDQAENGFSLRDQKDKLQKYCESKKIEIIKHFEDDGYSAKTFNRPEFNNLLEFIKKNKGLVKKLLIVKYDRFSRNMLASMIMKENLKKFGVTVEAIEQPLDDDIPETLIMEAIYLAAPQVENARRSLNTTNGMRRALKEGRYVSTAPYGFKNARDANGGKYFYYHCTKGCKERYKNDVAHNAFEIWLSDISIKPEMASLYLSVMEDVFKTNQGDKNAEIKRLQSEIDKNLEMMDKSAKKFVNDDLDKFDYKRIKENLSRENTELKTKIAELKSTETGFQEYYRYGFSLLSNLNLYYNAANLENKQKMLGLIFPEKLVFSNNTFQTMESNEVLTLLYNGGKGFSGNKKGLSVRNNEKSCEVTALGFKPKTF